jgi:hypothetical protein
MKFYYKFGEVETNTVWYKPSWDLFFKWWFDFKTTYNLYDYKFYVGGKFVIDNENTSDIDVIINGPIYDYEILYKLLKNGLELSLNKYNLFVDLTWYDNIDFFKYPRKEGFTRIHSKIGLAGEEIKIINDEIIYNNIHKTHMDIMNVHPRLAYNLVYLPMEKQIKDGRIYQPILLT